MIYSGIYALFLVLTLYSLYPTTAALAHHRARRAEKAAEKEKYATHSATTSPDGSNDMTAEQQWQHMWELQQLPRTPGTANAMFLKTPMTPRTRAFGDLEGGYGAGYGQQEGERGAGHGAQAHPSWVAHAHGQMAGTGGQAGGHAPSWYAGREEQAGFVAVQQVSPVAEREEYQFDYRDGGKAKGVGFAH